MLPPITLAGKMKIRTDMGTEDSFTFWDNTHGLQATIRIFANSHHNFSSKHNLYSLCTYSLEITLKPALEDYRSIVLPAKIVIYVDLQDCSLKHKQPTMDCEKSINVVFTESMTTYVVDNWIFPHHLEVHSRFAKVGVLIQIDTDSYLESISRVANNNAGAQLLTTGYGSDFVLIVGETKIPVHKVILGLASPVWAAMFEHDGVRENLESQLVIEDVSLETIRGLLDFIYAGKVPKFEDLNSGLELMKTADKVCRV